MPHINKSLIEQNQKHTLQLHLRHQLPAGIPFTIRKPDRATRLAAGCRPYAPDGSPFPYCLHHTIYIVRPVFSEKDLTC